MPKLFVAFLIFGVILTVGARPRVHSTVPVSKTVSVLNTNS